MGSHLPTLQLQCVVHNFGEGCGSPCPEPGLHTCEDTNQDPAQYSMGCAAECFAVNVTQ